MGRPSPRGTCLGDGTQLPLKYRGMLGRGDEGWGVRDGGTWQDGPGTIVEAQRQWVTCKETGNVYWGLLYTSLPQRPEHSHRNPTVLDPPHLHHHLLIHIQASRLAPQFPLPP